MKKLLMTAVLVVTACGGAGTTTISTRVGALSAGAPLMVGDVELQRVRIVIRELEVERGDDENEVEFESGPFLLDLSGDGLSGGVIQQFVTEVPPGVYDEVEFEIHPLSGDLPEDEGLREMFTRGASVIIDGVANGAAFSFESNLMDKQELEGSFDLGGGDNVTLNIDPSGWFLGASGEPLDPSDPANESTIEANIRQSIDAFDDDDSDGDDDDSDAGVDASGNQG